MRRFPHILKQAALIVALVAATALAADRTAQSSPIPPPARIGGTVTFNGSQLSRSDAENFVFKVTRADGTTFTDNAGNPSQSSGLNDYNYFILDIPIYDSESQPLGATAGATVYIHVYVGDVEATVSSPANGSFAAGSSGSMTEIDLNTTMSTSFILSLPAYSSKNPLSAYRMISIPLKSANNDLLTTLLPYFGSQYNNTVWRIFKENDTIDDSSPYIEIDNSDSDHTDTIDYGKGWMTISASQEDLKLTGYPSLSEVSMTIASTGYHLIGCPYADITLAWSDVVSDSDNAALGLNVDDSIYYWSGTGTEYSAATTLEPGKAYWIWFPVSGTLHFKRSYALGTAVGKGTTAQAKSPPPVAPGAYVLLSAPKGGERIKAGKTFTISWKAAGIAPPDFSGTVDLFYSTDGGATFLPIATNLANTKKAGSYKWKIPNTPTGTCVIKVASSVYPTLAATSRNLKIVK